MSTGPDRGGSGRRAMLEEDGRPTYVSAGNPIKMSALPDPKTRNPAPRLDGHRAAILKWLAEDGEKG